MIRRGSHLVLRALGSVLGALTFLLMLGALWLSSGPITVDALTPYVRKALNPADAPVSVEVGSTVLIWGGFDQAFEVRALGIRVFNLEGKPIAGIPELGVRFDIPALFRGQFAPTYLNLIRPRLRALRTEEGELRLDIATEESADNSGDSGVALALIQALQSPPDRSTTLGSLRQLRITDARLLVEDRQLGVTWRAPDADLWLRRTKDGLRGTAGLRIALPDHDATVEASLEQVPADKTMRIHAKLDELHISSLGSIGPNLAQLQGVDVPLTGTLAATLDDTLSVQDARLSVSSPGGTLHLPDYYAEAVPLGPVQLDVRGEADLSRLTLEQLTLDLGGAPLRISGTALRTWGQYKISAEANLSGLPVDRIATYWPQGVKHNTREWITQNLSGGQADNAWMTLALTVDANDPARTELHSLYGEIQYSGLNVHYFGDLPTVTDVSGSASFDTSAFKLDVAGGKLGSLTVGRSPIVISGLDAEDQAIRIEVPVSGPLADALRVLDSEPLGYASKLKLNPDLVSGMAEAKVTFAFPLIAALLIDDVDVQAKARLMDIGIASAVGDLPLTGGNLDLSVNKDQMQIDGTAALAEVPLELSWNEQFGDKADHLTRLTAKGYLEDADRARLGFETAPYLMGRMPADLVYTVKKPGAGLLDLSLDLSQTQLRMPAMGLERPAGTDAKAHAVISLKNQKLEGIRNFTTRAGGLSATGSAELSSNGKLKTLSISRLQGNDTDVALNMVAKAGGGYRVSAHGQAFNLEPFLNATGKKEESGGPYTPLDVTAHVERLVFGPERQLLNTAATASRDEAGWQRFEVAARMQGEGTLDFRYRPEGDAQSLAIEASDAGEALRVLDIFRNVHGGTLSIAGRSDPADPSDTIIGTMEMRSIEVRDAPAIARLLSALSLRGFGDYLQGQALRFDRFASDFRWDDIGIAFANGRTSGNALGLTFEGRLNLDADTADLQGTIVPVQGVNRVLGAIPLLGDVLIGGEGQGLFAATYSIKGPLLDPAVSVNPLAALAPGFLRNLFFMDAPVRVDEPVEAKPPQEKAAPELPAQGGQ